LLYRASNDNAPTRSRCVSNSNPVVLRSLCRHSSSASKQPDCSSRIVAKWLFASPNRIQGLRLAELVGCLIHFAEPAQNDA